MTNNFEIGSQWKTRGGWRAVVLKHSDDGLYAWHDRGERSIWDGDSIWRHDANGEAGTDHESFDLIEPWVEPKVHDVWINVYRHEREKGWICFGEDGDGYPMATKENADVGAKKGRLACVNVKFKEGEGL